LKKKIFSFKGLNTKHPKEISASELDISPQPSSANQLASFPSLMEAKKRLYLIRHGETTANASGIMQGSGIDLSLSEKGSLQAQLLGLRFRDEQVDCIISSDMKRAREVSGITYPFQTAGEIRKFHENVDYHEFKELREISWGKYDGSKREGEVLEKVLAVSSAWEVKTK
jgi:hypothetical protein